MSEREPGRNSRTGMGERMSVVCLGSFGLEYACLCHGDVNKPRDADREVGSSHVVL